MTRSELQKLVAAEAKAYRALRSASQTGSKYAVAKSAHARAQVQLENARKAYMQTLVSK